MSTFDLNIRTIDDVPHEQLKHLYAYWLRLRGERSLPLRTAFDPMHIPALLKHLCLLDVLDDGPPPRLRYRVAGTGITEFTGAEFTGRQVDDLIPAAFLPQALSIYEATLRHAGPVYAETCYHRGQGERAETAMMARLLLPLGQVDRLVSHLLVGYYYDLSALRLFPLHELRRYEVLALFAIASDPEEPALRVPA